MSSAAKRACARISADAIEGAGSLVRLEELPHGPHRDRRGRARRNRTKSPQGGLRHHRPRATAPRPRFARDLAPESRRSHPRGPPRARAGGADQPRGSRAVSCFFFNDTATTEIYTLSLHDALPI